MKRKTEFKPAGRSRIVYECLLIGTKWKAELIFSWCALQCVGVFASARTVSGGTVRTTLPPLKSSGIGYWVIYLFTPVNFEPFFDRALWGARGEFLRLCVLVIGFWGLLFVAFGFVTARAFVWRGVEVFDER